MTVCADDFRAFKSTINPPFLELKRMSAITFKKTQTDSEIRELATFLTKSVVFTGDGQYFTVAGPLCLSYYSTPDYWGDYVCKTWAGQNNQDCTVVVQDFGGGSDPYYRNGRGSPGAQLQTERTNATLGTDIYMPRAGNLR